MLSDNKYRFTLQWGLDTAEKTQAGQLLEKLGNRKSEFVVLAVTEYIKAHPDVTVPGSMVKISVPATKTDQQLQEMVQAMARVAVEELVSGMTLVPASGQAAEPAGPSQADLADMVANLDIFK